MKTKEQIINDVMAYNEPPADYNLLEIHCFLAMKQLLMMYQNKQVSSTYATKQKNHILGNYEKNAKQYEFEETMFQEHIQNIKDTERAKTKLRKLLNDGTPVTEDKLCRCLNLALEVLSIVFKGEF